MTPPETQHLLRLFSYRGLCPYISLSIHFYPYSFVRTSVVRTLFLAVISVLWYLPLNGSRHALRSHAVLQAFHRGRLEVRGRFVGAVEPRCHEDLKHLIDVAVGPVSKMAHKRHVAAAVVIIKIFAVVEPLDRVSVLGRKRLFEEQFLKT